MIDFPLNSDLFGHIDVPFVPRYQEGMEYTEAVDFRGTVDCVVTGIYEGVKGQIDAQAKYTGRCEFCSFYCPNEYLHCAINPSLPPNCPDFEIKR